ncbi:IclR family transcriptional regulator [Fodinicurvata halophila]|uniref:IclR family transcriptional regulator n=1 Tax=Fodinicurvata halophila TaxID=1419723 RepID=UPI00363AA4D2
MDGQDGGSRGTGAARPGAGGSDGCRLSDIAERTGLGKTTTHRLLSALVAVGFVERGPSSRLYRLGFGLFSLGMAARRFDVIELARPALQRLAERTGDTVFLSVRAGDEALCIDRATGSYPIKTLTLNVGDRRPLGVGAGSLALLAFLEDSQVERLLAANAAARRPYGAFDDESLWGMIVRARQQGHTFNDGRIVNAMNALGVPVHDGEGDVVAALSIAAIRERMSAERVDELQALLKEESAALSQQIGRAAPSSPPEMALLS